MMNESLYILFFSLAYLGLFSVSELLFRKCQVPAEHTRKLVHFGSGILALLFPIYFENLWAVGILCGGFLALLFLSYAWNILPSINQVQRKTWGSVLFPIVVFCCFFLAQNKGNLSYYYSPILVLAISDPLAALIGKNFPVKAYRIFGQGKSLGGSLAFLISAGLILNFSLLNLPFSVVLLSAGSACLMEAVSTHGWDNLMIPIGVIFPLLLF